MTVLRWYWCHMQLDVERHDSLRDAVISKYWEGDHGTSAPAYMERCNADGTTSIIDVEEVSRVEREYEAEIEAEDTARRKVEKPIVAKVTVKPNDSYEGRKPTVTVEWCTSEDDAREKHAEWVRLLGAERVQLRRRGEQS